jgi:hypothetical protein
MSPQTPNVTNSNLDTDTDFGVIKRTTNYQQFMYMGGNRAVDVKHVLQLQAQMERNREMFASQPILVNENWYIVDGQHRYEAAKALGLPIYYIRQKNVGLSDARQLNIAQKRWGIKDFAQSYADSGRPDYKRLLEIKRDYPKIPLSTVADYLTNARGGGESSGRFRRGEFHIANESDALAALDLLAEVVKIVGRPASTSLASALQQVIKHDDFDERVFIRKLQENPETLVMATSVRACLRGIEEVYNRHNKMTIRLY